jgi:hypothetical protein
MDWWSTAGAGGGPRCRQRPPFQGHSGQSTERRRRPGRGRISRPDASTKKQTISTFRYRGAICRGSRAVLVVDPDRPGLRPTTSWTPISIPVVLRAAQCRGELPLAPADRGESGAAATQPAVFGLSQGAPPTAPRGAASSSSLCRRPSIPWQTPDTCCRPGSAARPWIDLTLGTTARWTGQLPSPSPSPLGSDKAFPSTRSWTFRRSARHVRNRSNNSRFYRTTWIGRRTLLGPWRGAPHGLLVDRVKHRTMSMSW